MKNTNKIHEKDKKVEIINEPGNPLQGQTIEMGTQGISRLSDSDAYKFDNSMPEEVGMCIFGLEKLSGVDRNNISFSIHGLINEHNLETSDSYLVQLDGMRPFAWRVDSSQLEEFIVLSKNADYCVIVPQLGDEVQEKTPPWTIVTETVSGSVWLIKKKPEEVSEIPPTRLSISDRIHADVIADIRLFWIGC